MRVELTLLLLVLASACRATSGAAVGDQPFSTCPANDLPVIEVVLLPDGQCSLNGDPVPDSSFSVAYEGVAQRYSSGIGPAKSSTRITVRDPASTSWARLEPVVWVYAEHYGEALFVQGHQVLFPVCDDCCREEHSKTFAPIRIAEEPDYERLCADLHPAVGGMAIVHFQPACSVEVFVLALQALDDSGIPYVISGNPPADDSLILAAPYEGEEEPPEEVGNEQAIFLNAAV